MTVDFRKYTPSDYEELKRNLQEAELFNESWDSQKSVNQEFITNPDSRLIVEVNGEFAGSIHLIYWGGNGSFLFHFAVKKKFRGQGIGTQLLQEAEKRLKQMGAKQVGIFVEVSSNNLLDYYKKHGYNAFIQSMALIKTL